MYIEEVLFAIGMQMVRQGFYLLYIFIYFVVFIIVLIYNHVQIFDIQVF